MNTGTRDSAELSIGAARLVWGRRTYLMGVLNVTPDSFSGDGMAGDGEALRRRVRDIVDSGADIVDIGGESTRPGAPAVPAEDELARVLPAIAAVRMFSQVPISIDTRRASVAAAAVEAGADAINDVSGLGHDPDMLGVAAASKVPVVLTHNRRARAVQSAIGWHYAGVRYENLARDVLDAGRGLIERALKAGIAAERLIFDPGFGFGKTPEQNLELLRDLEDFTALGLPLLVGLSRKSFVGNVLKLPVGERLEGSLAAAVIAVSKGADIVRTHDVAATRRALAFADAIYRRG